MQRERLDVLTVCQYVAARVFKKNFSWLFGIQHLRVSHTTSTISRKDH